jgi:hypothetical protein
MVVIAVVPEEEWIRVSRRMKKWVMDVFLWKFAASAEARVSGYEKIATNTWEELTLPLFFWLNFQSFFFFFFSAAASAGLD